MTLHYHSKNELHHGTESACSGCPMTQSVYVHDLPDFARHQYTYIHIIYIHI